MEEIAPGSILVKMYLEKRLKQGNYQTFCEIGAGNGNTSALLLQMGLTGKGFDLNAEACQNNSKKNKKYIDAGLYSVKSGNFFEESITEKFDLIISCMVIEHLSDNDVKSYFTNCKRYLNKNGRILLTVPSCMKYWGIEDESAGHFKRYEFDDFNKIASEHSLKIIDISGLTYPISNILFRLSNYLIERNDAYKKKLSMQEQTILSGNRNIKYKTVFPKYYKLILNEIVLYPFYILQRIFRNNPNSIVIYCEFAIA